jgi:hypothetical protein
VEEKTLTEKESKKIAKLLSRAVKNKEHPHPADLQRAAVALYTARECGYILTEAEVYDIIEQSGESYSETMKGTLGSMADAYNDLVYGLNNSENKSFRFEDGDISRSFVL